MCPTTLEKKREERYDTVKENFKFAVLNHTSEGSVETEFHELDQVLHKIKLDLMTMAHHAKITDSAIEVQVRLKD